MCHSFRKKKKREGTDDYGQKDGIKDRPISKLEEKSELHSMYTYYLAYIIEITCFLCLERINTK